MNCIEELEREYGLQRCHSCGQPPIVKPKCHLCRRAMEDWPDDPERFLLERGWQQAEHTGNWLQPLADCTYEVSDEAVDEARARVKQAQTYADFPHVANNKDRLKAANANVAVAQEALDKLVAMQEAGERTDISQIVTERYCGTDRRGQALIERHTTLSKRHRCQFAINKAVRLELNKDIPFLHPRKTRVPKFSDVAMDTAERSYLLKDKGSLTPDSRNRLDTMRYEQQEVFEEQCVYCRRWPSTLP